MAQKKKPAAEAQGDGREQVTIDLTDEAAGHIRDFVAVYGGRGMKKTVLSRLVTWFAEQPDWMKQVVLGWAPTGVKKTYADALRVLADQLEEEDSRSSDGGVVFIPSSLGRGAVVGPTAKESPDTESTRSRERSGRAAGK